MASFVNTMLMKCQGLWEVVKLNSLPRQAFLLSWMITVFSLAFNIYISKSYNSIWTLLLYIPLSLMMIHQNEFQRREISKLNMNKDREITKVKAEADANAKEQQSMVSNVAHDLKTVSNKNIVCLIYNSFLKTCFGL